ncbi:MAG: hypothetical protein JWP17_2200 [Solirubrobacterales bacterium]|nr:hypothetical protein [Solirubrobacterales bacterium]
MRRPLLSLCALLALLAVAPAAHAKPPWPSTTLQLGMEDAEGGAAALKASAPFGLRYHYLAGGVNTGSSWQSWATGGGSFVTNYIEDSVANGMVPAFSYYELRQSQPGSGRSDEQQAIVANLANRDTMRSWLEDLKVFFQRAGATAQTTVLQVEPDMWGYIQRQGGDDAAKVLAQVAGSGMPELRGLPDTAAGLAQAVVRLRDTYAPNVSLGYQLSIWGTGKDIAVSDEGDEAVDALADRSAAFYTSLGASMDTVFAEFADRDSGYAVKRDGKGESAWWDAADFARFARYLGDMHAAVKLPIVLWQIPLGNTLHRAMDDTAHHYADNRVQWLLGGDTRDHLKAYLDSGVVALLFGSGQADGTCACDAAGDGVTNPPANGTATRASLNADDDGGYFRSRVNAYDAAGPLALPATTRAPRRTNGSAPVSLAHPGRFSTRADVAKAVVKRGGTVAIRASFRATKAQTALISIEVYRDSTQVFQKTYDNATLRKGRVRSFLAHWKVAGDAPSGTYSVRLGVFAPGFKGLRTWNPGAARITVR